MVVSIGVKQPPNHPLVLRVVFARLGLEEVHATLAQRDRDLDAFLPKDQVLGPRKEVRNDLQLGSLPPPPVTGPEDADDVAAIRESDRQDAVDNPADGVIPCFIRRF